MTQYKMDKNINKTTPGSKNKKKISSNIVQEIDKESNHNGPTVTTLTASQHQHIDSNCEKRLHHLSSSSSEHGSSGSNTNALADLGSMQSITGELGDLGDDLSEVEFKMNHLDTWTEGELGPDEEEELSKLQRSIAKMSTKEQSDLILDQAKLLFRQDGAEKDGGARHTTVDPETQHRLELLLEAAGVGKLASPDGKAFADPEVLRKLTSSVSCALDEAAAALTKMRAEQQLSMESGSEDAVDPLNRTLADACADGDIDAVKRLLSEGQSVHETTDEGDSLLGIACSKGFYELAEVLLHMKANVEDRGCKSDLTPLMEAASSGFVNIVKLLISYDADVNAQSSAGHTALHHAAVGGFEDTVSLLISAGANVEEQNENGHTPLMEAASAGHVNVARILLDAGAGINTHSNEFKESALTLACYKGHLEMVKFLLDAGADQEHKTDEMHTALMETSMDGHVEVARLLLDSGAQVNMPADSFESPLTLAACGGHVELANLLIERGANLEEVNDEGYTPLMEAAREGHEEMVALLLAHGADVNAQTEEMQETALTLSCCGGFLEVAHFLIRANADIELGCSTPLMEAAQEGHLDLVKYLIKQGANVQAVTQTGDSALTYACENGHTDVADVLLQAGAELEHLSEGGRTPLMKAARAGHFCTVQFLISKGADVNASTTNKDHTVLSLSCAGGHLNVVEILLKHGADPMYKLKDGSTMLIEAAKGGHTNVVNMLLDYPMALHKSIAAAVSSEYPETIPMADDMPSDISLPKEFRNTETLAARLEGFIHKMMCQAENLSGTREEQMAKKQEILEELQRVEQELKIRTQIAQENQPVNGTPDNQAVSLDHGAVGDPVDDTAMPPPPAPPAPIPFDGAGDLTMNSPLSLDEQEVMNGLSEQHELVVQDLIIRQQALQDPQNHELELQQQKEFYQARLQSLKQQYHQKQLQLQQHREQLLSQATSNNNTCVNTAAVPNNLSEETQTNGSANRLPIPLHIALQNHLHAHHVTDGNVSDLAQALQDWDTRDRNITLNQSQLQPMPTFNLSTTPSAEPRPPNDLGDPEPPPSVDPGLTHVEEPLPLRMPEPLVEQSPPSRSLADALHSLIQGQDSKFNASGKNLPALSLAKSAAASIDSFDYGLEKALESNTNLKGKPDLDQIKTLQWLQSMQENIGLPVPKPDLDQNKTEQWLQSMHIGAPVPKPAPKKNNKVAEEKAKLKKLYPNNDKLSTLAAISSVKQITKVPNTAVANQNNQTNAANGSQSQRSTSPPRVPFVDPNAETESNHDTALTLACAGGHAELVRLLLSRNAEIEHRDKKGFTPLILASTAGHAEVVEILASSGADIEAQSERTKDTPLSLACSGGRYEVVEILLKLGANKEHRNVSDYTPLSLAASGGYVNIIKLLLSYGAEINSRTGSKLGISPLMLAAMNGHTAAVKLLLDMGSDINAQIETNRNTALTLACFQGRHDVVSLLVDRRANIEHRAKTGLTPLMEAASGGYVEVGEVLLDKLAEVNAAPVPSSKDTALTIAADKGHYRFVELLLARNACVDVKNKKGNSPLWLACNGGHLDVIQLLVSSGADIDSHDNRKVSCLMAAYRKGHIKVVKWLVDNVATFPSDQECIKPIQTHREKADEELFKKIQECYDIIMETKESQSKEALRNAAILLEQLETEKSHGPRDQAGKKKKGKKKMKKCGKAEDSEEKYIEIEEMTSAPSKQRGGSKKLTSARISDNESTSSGEVRTREGSSGKENKDRRDTKDKNKQNENKENKVSSKKVAKEPERIPAPPVERFKEPVPQPVEREKPSSKSKKGKKKQSDNLSSANQSKNNNANIEPIDVKTAQLAVHFNRISDLDDFGEPIALAPIPANQPARSKRAATNPVSLLDNFPEPKVGSKIAKQLAPPAPSPGKKKKGDEGWKEVTKSSTSVKSKKSSNASKQDRKGHDAVESSKRGPGATIDPERVDSTSRRSATERIASSRSSDATKTGPLPFSSVVAGSASGGSKFAAGPSPKPGGVAWGRENSQGGPSDVPQDPMSQISTFKISDFIVTSATRAALVDTKPKNSQVPAQAKPGWPIRPTGGQFSWGTALTRPSVASTQVTTSTRPVNVSSPHPIGVQPPIRPPGPQQVVKPSPTPTDVSRQLFNEPLFMPVSVPENRAPGHPSIQRSPQLPIGARPPAPIHPGPISQPSPGSRSQMSPAARSQESNNSTAFSAGTKSPFEPLPIGTRPTAMISATSTAAPMSSGMLSGNIFAAQSLITQQADPAKAPGFKPVHTQQIGLLTPQAFGGFGSQVQPQFMGFTSNPAQNSMTDRLMKPYTSLSSASASAALLSHQACLMNPHQQDFLSNSLPSSGFSNRQHGSPAPYDQNQYTYGHQPMTLPRIPSSLNPNANEFTASQGGRGDDRAGVAGSPRGHYQKQQSSPVEYRPNTSPPSNNAMPQPGSYPQQQQMNNPQDDMYQRQRLFQQPGMQQAMQASQSVSQRAGTYSPAKSIGTPPLDEGISPRSSNQSEFGVIGGARARNTGPNMLNQQPQQPPIYQPQQNDLWDANYNPDRWNVPAPAAGVGNDYGSQFNPEQLFRPSMDGYGDGGMNMNNRVNQFSSSGMPTFPRATFYQSGPTNLSGAGDSYLNNAGPDGWGTSMNKLNSDLPQQDWQFDVSSSK